MPLVLLPAGTAARPAALRRALGAWRATRLLLVPTALRMLLDACEAAQDLGEEDEVLQAVAAARRL